MSETVGKIVQQLGASPGLLVIVLLNAGIFWLIHSQGVVQHETRQQLIRACLERPQ